MGWRISGVYGVFNHSNGKVYIGSSIDVLTRWKSHVYAFEHGEGAKRTSVELQNEWYLYGPSQFTFALLEMLPTEEKRILWQVEQKWMDRFPNLYNICLAGAGSFKKGYTMPATTRAKISARMQILSPVINRDPGFRARVSATLTGHEVTPTTRAKISATLKGKPWTDKRRKAQQQKGESA